MYNMARKTLDPESSRTNPPLKKVSESTSIDIVLHKLEQLQSNQDKIHSGVEKVRDAIYDPEEGIFVKLAEAKLENLTRFNTVDNRLTELLEWKKYKEKEEVKDEKAEEKKLADSVSSEARLAMLETSVKSLQDTKSNTWSFFKWTLVALGTGLVALLFKIFESKIFH